VKILPQLVNVVKMQLSPLQHSTAWQQNPGDRNLVHGFNVDNFCKTVCKKMFYAIQIAH
jgi:hypothetical protein